MDANDPRAAAFKAAVEAADATALRALLDQHADLVNAIDSPRFSFGPYSALDCLVDSPEVDDDFADFLIARGAKLDIHAAAGLGRISELERLLDAAPDRVNEPGPDGAAPLHLARNVETVSFLLDRGADLEQRCVDHNSTPVMWSAQRPMEALASQGRRRGSSVAAENRGLVWARGDRAGTPRPRCGPRIPERGQRQNRLRSGRGTRPLRHRGAPELVTEARVISVRPAWHVTGAGTAA
jgi:ankyrin repeat protein